ERRPTPCSLAAARAYCRELTRNTYENFTVGSWLLSRRLRPHFYSIYAWCRWADDLADEPNDPQESLRLLGWWEDQLDACYAGEAVHPVLVALGDTVTRFEIPQQLFRDLIRAFRQDQQKTR